MNSRERLLTTLNHQEPDRIPLDLGSTQVTGIHAAAYGPLRRRLGLPRVEPVICDAIQQLALPDEDMLEFLGVDTRGLFPLNSHNWNVVDREAVDSWEYLDEWGITHRRPRPDGLYYTAVRHPLDRADLTAADIRAHPWPRTADPRRIAGLRARAQDFRSRGKAVVIKGVLAGIFEMSQRVRGTERLLMDMAAEPLLAEALFDKMLELTLDFWEMALPALGDMVDVVSLADDYGSQTTLLISPRMFRRPIKPRLAALIRRVKELAPHSRVFLHSCGNVRPLLPDLIEMGVDILNPVHIRATGMEPAALKRDFGNDLVFWGGGVDTQGVLPHGTPAEVIDEVRRNVEALAPGGGFVFAAVHNIQADVPPANMAAMWETLGRYRG